MEALSHKHCCRGKAKSTIYYVCVFLPQLFGIQTASLLLNITLSSVACLPLPSFTLTYTWHDLKKKKIAHKMSLQFFLQILSETYTILRRIQRDIIINVRRSSCTVPHIFCPISMKLKFS